MSIEHALNKIFEGEKIESQARKKKIYISVPKPPNQLGSIGVKTKNARICLQINRKQIKVLHFNWTYSVQK
jgi:hypothetical protein